MDREELIKSCMEALMASSEMAYVRDLIAKASAEPEVEPDAEVKVKAQADDEEPEDKLKAEAGDEEPEKLKEERDQLQRKYAKLEYSHKDMMTKVAQLERKARVADRKAELLKLEGEHISFDMASELEDVSDLNESEWKKHVVKMRKNYARDPVGIRIAPLEMKDELSSDNIYANIEKLVAEKYGRK